MCKRNCKKYGKTLPKTAEIAVPWNRVDLVMIGPWSVHTADAQTHKLRALTMIDPTTGWFEVAEVLEIDFSPCAAVFDDVWLSR